MPDVLTQATDVRSHVAGPSEPSGGLVALENIAAGDTGAVALTGKTVQRCLRCDALLAVRRDKQIREVGSRVPRDALGQPCPGRID